MEVLDGFGSHFNCPKALEILWKYKILQVKEEGDTSHVCQMYDQEPAKRDKAVQRTGTCMLRVAAGLS